MTNNELEFSNLIDEFSKLHLKLEPLQERYEVLKKRVKDVANNDKSPEGITLFGLEFCVDYSKPAAESKCKLTAEKFIEETGRWDAISVSTTAARKALTDIQFKELFSISPGSRRICEVKKLI